jgi:transposase
MRAYSVDLRSKNVEAIWGMSRAKAARAFGVGISTVERYMKREPKEAGVWC